MHFLIFLTTAITAFATEMSLINEETGQVVVTFKNGSAHFNNRFLEEEMKEIGIPIPFLSAPDFEDRQVIYLQDPLFEKAFIEVYCPSFLNDSIYQWQK